MGADIHLWVERKLPSGKWVMHDRCRRISREAHSIDPPASHKDYFGDMAYHRVNNRNYRFFAALAGVRGDGPEPRGLPPDVSDYVQYESDDYGVDGHSHSWMMASEFMPIFAEHHLNPEYAVRVVAGEATWLGVFEKIFGTYVDGPEGLDNYRMVFFFDN